MNLQSLRETVRRGFLAACLLAAPGAAALPAAAQDSGAQEVFSESLDVQAVDVQVLVTDKKGRPVQGLTAADLRLLVDGKEVPVEYFVEIQDGTRIAAPAGAAAPQVPPALAAQGEAVPNRYLVFIDEYFTPPQTRNEALRALAREVATMRPQDRMAIVSYGGRKLKVLTPWTGPGEPLRQFLEKLGGHKASLASTPFSFGELEPSTHVILEQISNQLDASAMSGSLIDPRILAASYVDYVERSIAAAEESMRAFAGISGRKLLVLMSGGWTYDIDIKRKTADREERLVPLIETCNLLGYTLYPLQLARYGPADLPRAGGHAVNSTLGTGATAHVGTPGERGLMVIAEETGGKYLLPGNNKHLSRIADDTRSYYWLGFTHSGPRRSHAVRVEAVRPGLQVRARKSFVPLSPEERLDLDLERALLARDTAGMGPLAVSPGALKKVDGDLGELPVTVTVPVESLSLARQDGRYRGKLELRIAALDDQGNRSDMPVLRIDLARDEPPAPGAVVRHDTTLRVRYAPQDIQLVLYDTLSGKSFAERLRVQP
ncbi:MAG TPA: VWA domain-containing protein [Thermoanaerobaculia bacterium]|nr:VWA domain-containing protein [Thermoanaerobaculia bacterium]